MKSIPQLRAVDSISTDSELQSYLGLQSEIAKALARREETALAFLQSREELIKVLPIRNVSFKIKVDGKDYLIRKELDQYEKETLVISQA